VLDTDDKLRAARRLVPDGFEVAFGGPDDALPPVRVALPSGATVAFKGRIDRVDVSLDDGHREVFDYKTGRVEFDAETLAADPVQEGRKLQLPIYALAVREADTPPVRGSYWYTREAGIDGVPGVTFDSTNEDRVHEVLDIVTEQIAAGHFPPYPGPDHYWYGPDNCRHCDFTDLCPSDRVQRFERRRADPAYDGILDLREPAEDEEPEDEGPEADPADVSEIGGAS
jgi:ATP-dependent helicase/nuclease subunit B